MLFVRMKSVLAGKRLWNKIQRKYDICNKYFIILKEKEPELAIKSMEFLDEFLRKKYSQGAIILTTDKSITSKNGEVIIITSKEEEGILSYFNLYPFYDKVIVVSLKEPYGSYGLLNKEGITMEDMIKEYIFV